VLAHERLERLERVVVSLHGERTASHFAVMASVLRVATRRFFSSAAHAAEHPAEHGIAVAHIQHEAAEEATAAGIPVFQCCVVPFFLIPLLILFFTRCVACLLCTADNANATNDNYLTRYNAQHLLAAKATWKKISQFVAIPGTLLVAVNTYIAVSGHEHGEHGDHHEEAHKFGTYLHIRNKVMLTFLDFVFFIYLFFFLFPLTCSRSPGAMATIPSSGAITTTNTK